MANKKHVIMEDLTPEISITIGIYGVSICPLKNLTSKTEEEFVENNITALTRRMNKYDRDRGAIGTINYRMAERKLEDAYSDYIKQGMKRL